MSVDERSNGVLIIDYIDWEPSIGSRHERTKLTTPSVVRVMTALYLPRCVSALMQVVRVTKTNIAANQ